MLPFCLQTASHVSEKVAPDQDPPNVPERAVSIEHLTHRYGERTALRDVALSIRPGALAGLLGPNGSGKTTLFRILSTLMRPTEGHAFVFGHDTAAAPEAVRRRLGVVFQEPSLDEALSVEENLRIHSTLYGLSAGAARSRIAELLRRFDLEDRAGDRVQALSGGLRRRAGLDPVARRAFWQHLERLRRTEDTTLLVATHLMEEAERCNHVMILDRGRLVGEGAPETLKAALGREVLWLETDDPAALRDRVQARFGVEAQVIGQTVQIAHPEAHTLLGALYEALGAHIESATVRRPTLEDVFMLHTGHRPEGATLSAPSTPFT